MKTSRYNVFVDNPSTNETVLYNTLYGSMTVWEQSEVETVKQVLDHPNAKLPLDLADKTVRHVLIDQKHLVEDKSDEISIVEGRKIAGVRDTNRLDVILMPTLDCNFACTYCYETHHASIMHDETELAIQRWLAAEVPLHPVTLLNWFGGEPLLGYRKVLSISQHAADVARQANVSLVMHMTTNGYLFSERRIKELLDVGLYDYQITLDGPPDVHDRLRVLRNGGGTFERVFHNIIALASAHERVKISLRINFNHSNLHAIPQLLEMFPTTIRPHLRVVYEPIFGDCTLSATDNVAADEISSAMANHYKLAKDLGFDVVLGLSGMQTGKLVYCYAERENQVIVNYNGDVYKCSVGKFDAADRAGYIRDDGVLVKEGRWHSWVDEMNLFEERCYECSYLPLCMGGCRQMRQTRRETGSYCTLVPTNASYLLKQIAFGNLAGVLCEEITSP